MRARNLWVLSIVVLAVALLVTVGYWGISRGGRVLAQEPATTTTEQPPDGFPQVSFKCYVINQGTAPKEEVRLCDQFHGGMDCPVDGEGGKLVTVREPQLLCTQARKIRDGATTTETVDFDYLKCYNITPAGPSVNQKVTVFDQFFPEDGDQVKVQTAQYLCESASKEVLTPTP